MFKVSDLLIEECFSSSDHKTLAGLSFNLVSESQESIFFGISKDVAAIELMPESDSKLCVVMYRGIRFVVDEVSGQKLESYLSAVKVINDYERKK